MIDWVQVLAGTEDYCKGIGPIVNLLKNGVLPIFQIGIPILLIIFGSIDLGKAVMSSDDKEIKGATGKLIKRIIMGVVIFFIPFIITLVMNVVASNSDKEATDAINWANCWKEA